MASAVRSKVIAAVAPLRQSAVGKMAEEQICALPGKLKQGKADWGAHLKALDEAGLIKKKPEEYAKLKEMVSASRKYQCVPFVRPRREGVRPDAGCARHFRPAVRTSDRWVEWSYRLPDGRPLPANAGAGTVGPPETCGCWQVDTIPDAV
jgi:hypothetical protein